MAWEGVCVSCLKEIMHTARAGERDAKGLKSRHVRWGEGERKIVGRDVECEKRI